MSNSTQQSYVQVGETGTTRAFVGPDAVNLMRAITLASGIELWIKTKMLPTRGCTITYMLEMAKGYTSKTYKRSQAAQAAADVRKWVETMKAAIPAVNDKGEPA